MSAATNDASKEILDAQRKLSDETEAEDLKLFRAELERRCAEKFSKAELAVAALSKPSSTETSSSGSSTYAEESSASNDTTTAEVAELRLQLQQRAKVIMDMQIDMMQQKRASEIQKEEYAKVVQHVQSQEQVSSAMQLQIQALRTELQECQSKLLSESSEKRLLKLKLEELTSETSCARKEAAVTQKKRQAAEEASDLKLQYEKTSAQLRAANVELVSLRYTLAAQLSSKLEACPMEGPLDAWNQNQNDQDCEARSCLPSPKSLDVWPKAEKCTLCGESMGVIAGLRGLGIRQRCHGPRCRGRLQKKDYGQQ